MKSREIRISVRPTESRFGKYVLNLGRGEKFSTNDLVELRRVANLHVEELLEGLDAAESEAVEEVEEVEAVEAVDEGPGDESN